ncbi:HAD-IA family hydrolase [Roseospira marina]|uniref:HAD-IA family hydrolase n=1 Tax=Roseospira marina TaxID=140057 RepID=A0A5M6IBW7_9PROT|nr:HAD-IA family hydrolase [Roseospira marina]KAA5605612.1 HAD-IA family hydrolase [Roseospira marina]MBB4313318.1 beta-phosphoglucomutase family hydrolase [Roseospira marina]MBB5085941.1 beta-phosphoglucomutase family hydrolase [Roseospira marina]
MPHPTPWPWAGKGLKAIICDLDGVVTDTAAVHATAWKNLFDAVLRAHSEREGVPFVPFSTEDYLLYVDGRPRYDGVRTFLASRGIAPPEGSPEDSPELDTICGLGNRKNAEFNSVIQRDGVTVFDRAVALIRQLRSEGLRTAVVSSSKNCGPVLASTGLLDLFDAQVDGVYAAAKGLPGKPAPDTFIEGARLAGVTPAESIMVEDALSGVQAGRDGGFGLVIGIDRGAGDAALRENGADIVVKDLGDFFGDH